MADTIGSLVDKLATVNNKLFVNQDLFYKIRAMDFETFARNYLDDVDGRVDLFKFLQKMSDLNLQRNQLINEVDTRIVELIKRAVAGEEIDDGRSVQQAHKTHAEAPIVATPLRK
jgi:hypothetical protein